MSEQCNSTGTWFSVDWILSQLVTAEKWANDTYAEKLEAAIVKRTGKSIPVSGWKGLILRRTRLTTREDAEKFVNNTDDFWGSIEWSIRDKRDKFISRVVSLRQAATTAQKAEVSALFVSKDDMVYLS